MERLDVGAMVDVLGQKAAQDAVDAAVGDEQNVFIAAGGKMRGHGCGDAGLEGVIRLGVFGAGIAVFLGQRRGVLCDFLLPGAVIIGHRALEDAPAPDLTQIRIVRFSLDDEGEIVEKPKKGITNYRMEVFLPASILSGFDPETNHRLGFCYRLRDRELGDQTSAAGPEFPYWEDPSLWSVLELVRK